MQQTIYDEEIKDKNEKYKFFEFQNSFSNDQVKYEISNPANKRIKTVEK